MKTPIKHLFPIVMAAMGLFFAAVVLFKGLLGTDKGIYTDIGTGLTEATEMELINSVSDRNQESEIEIPAIKYIGGARTVGEEINFKKLFQFTYEDGMVISGTDEAYITMYLNDIKDASGNSVCEKFSTADIDAMEEIPSAFILDQEQNILYFHKSGIFKVLIKVYYDATTDVLYEFTMPVEVG